MLLKSSLKGVAIDKVDKRGCKRSHFDSRRTAGGSALEIQFESLISGSAAVKASGLFAIQRFMQNDEPIQKRPQAFRVDWQAC